MTNRLLIALLVAALITAAAAQTRGGFGGFHHPGGLAGHHGHGFGGRNAVWFGDPFYSDYSSQPAEYEPPAPPVVIVQPSSAAATPEPVPEPLIIEWQGDKYVRFSGQRQLAASDYSEIPSGATRVHKPAFDSSTATQAASVELAPVVLVYPDGRREKVSDYVIANGNLYARGDYWRDGFWTKTVQLSALDIPATRRANSESGVKFVLPSGPNEVVTRP
jgi:hypothetical protein